jgi:sarcosine oxidase
MKRSFDTIVLGCGGLGSAALYWLSRRTGSEVLGIEQFSLGHANGASQDHSRIIRLSYDDPAYAALTPFTYIAWKEVEAESGIQVVFQTGGIIFGPGGLGAESEVQRYATAMRRSGIPYEALTPAETMRRFPQFTLKEDDEVLYQSYSGFVDPGKATAVHAILARARGATILENTTVKSLHPTHDGVRLETSAGTFEGRRLVLTTGAWSNNLLAGVGVHLPLTVTEEQVTYFATPNLRQFTPDRFPVWIWHGDDCFYGFPIYGEVATKAGQDLGGETITVETRKNQPNLRPLNRLQRFLESRIPGSLGPVLYTKPCMYTMPPDRGFILDTLPDFPQISMTVGAGHAFKFASLIGRILSDLALDGNTSFDISAFSLQRPALTDPNFVSLLKIVRD